MRHILGISAFYHDSAAVLLRDGEIVAAAQEERFTRRKHDDSFPREAIRWCLERGAIRADELDAVAFYEKPIRKFARSLEVFLTIAPRGLRSFLEVMPNWLGERLDLPGAVRGELPELSASCVFLFPEHHLSHAASAYYPSPFSEAAVLTIDGVGEYATTTLGMGKGGTLEILKEIRFPHSLGLLYSAFTSYCGFRVNSGEYKLMGLAPYGRPRYADRIREHLIDLKDDGSFRLNLDYLSYLRGRTMTNKRFHRLFEGVPRVPESEIDQRHMDLAASIQAVTEQAMLHLARYAREVTGCVNLCMAGGVALNCVANGVIQREKIFERLWIQPAAGDAGGALGAAMFAWHHDRIGGRENDRATDSMHGALLGPEFRDEEIEPILVKFGASYERLEEDELIARTAALIADQQVIGWFQGRMEYGPRALGSRSILGDPRSSKLQSEINRKIKFRESFRPFAPAVLEEKAHEYFNLASPSPYMLIVAEVKETIRRAAPGEERPGLERLHEVRSEIPAVTHVDFSARVQTVGRDANPRFLRLLQRFHEMTGCAALINTSFNVRGEPIVCTPEDAYRCFVNTNLDFLVIGSFLLDRRAQPTGKVVQNFHPVPD